MSYASLIFKDNPEVVWALNEPTGAVAYTDGFVSGLSYEGQYLTGKYSRSALPITYGGKVSFHNNGSFLSNYSSDATIFKLPSVNKFTSATKSGQYSLEFWMNIDFNQKSLESGAFQTISFLDRNLDGGFYNTIYTSGDNADGGVPGTISYPDGYDGGGIFQLNAASRIGETALMKLSGTDTSTGVYIKDLDYLVFRLGDTGMAQYESAVHVSDFNKPLHIVCVYTPKSMRIVVNGKSGNVVEIDDSPFNEVISRDMLFCMPSRVSTLSKYFTGVNYDTVSLYGVALSDETIKRHFVYGLGYGIDRSLIKSLGGISYESNLQKTTPVKRIDYNLQNSWSPNTIYSNLDFRDKILSTKSHPEPKLYINGTKTVNSYPYKLTYKDMMTSDNSGDYFTFPENAYSYMEIERYEAITGGQTKRVSAKFKLNSTHGTNAQQLMYIGSRSSSSALSFEITNKVVSAKIIKNGSVVGDTMSHTLGNLTKDFMVSFAANGNDVEISIQDIEGNGNLWDVQGINIFPMQDAYLRFGSKPVFFGENPPLGLSYSQVGRYDGNISQIDIGYYKSAVDTWDNYPEKNDGDIYQAYVNKDLNRIQISTRGSFAVRYSLLELIGPQHIGKTIDQVSLPVKIEVGSNNADITFGCGIRGQQVYLVDGNIRNLHLPTVIGTQPKVEDIYYDIVGTLFTSDTNYAPAQVEYLRLYSYPFVEDGDEFYVEINNPFSGINPRYYNKNYPFKSLPDLNKTTDLYRSFNTGFLVGHREEASYDELAECSPYLKIPFYSLPISNNTAPKIYGIAFAARAIEDGYSDCNLLEVDSNIITSEGLSSIGSIDVYINGQQAEYSVDNQFVWNYYFVKFNEGISITSSQLDILFGNNGSAFYIDNISIFTTNLNSSSIAMIYERYFSESVIRVGSGNEELTAIHIKDSEKTDGINIFQPLGNENNFYPVRIYLASETNIPLTAGPSITIGTNLDNMKIDQVSVIVGKCILLKSQSVASENGIYLVSSITYNGTTPTKINLTKQTNYTDGDVFFISEGKSNKNLYFKKSSNNYSKVPVQRKVLSFSLSATELNPLSTVWTQI